MSEIDTIALENAFNLGNVYLDVPPDGSPILTAIDAHERASQAAKGFNMHVKATEILSDLRKPLTENQIAEMLCPEVIMCTHWDALANPALTVFLGRSFRRMQAGILGWYGARLLTGSER